MIKTFPSSQINTREIRQYWHLQKKKKTSHKNKSH